MTIVAFQDFKFKEEDNKVKCVFMKHYFFYVEKETLAKISAFKIDEDSLEFDASQKTVTNKFNRLLKIGFSNLINVFGNKTIYIHRDSSIPLLGSNEFGIVDRGTNLIEVKPLSLCNLDCIYCSVDAGKSSKKKTDFLVEPSYLVEEFQKIASLKKNLVEVSINPQGEPLMYSRIVELVKELKKHAQTISMNTNGLLLTEKLIDKLVEAGLSRINLSLNTLNKETADKLSGAVYPIDRIKKVLGYCEGKIEVLIAPLIVPGYNDSDIKEMVEFCKGKYRMGFQNFLSYKKGRNPVKAKSMDWFFKLLRKHESELVNSAEDYNIFDDTKIPKPFKKRQMIEATVICPGKYSGEFICVAQNRCIVVSGNLNIGERIKIRIIRDKHNIFKGLIQKS
jgi:hypothetical protein